MKKHKKKSWVGWVHEAKIYHELDNEYIATGTVIYKKKRFDTPYKVRVTTEVIK